ncbi:U3 small nucleolar RNA-associated protein 5 [Hanseniaspora uvarum DSM 2768]|nr:U3 small nucleolar RNA-associated protein 5 [Hanseniaspora uvarum DSM 2768]
MSIDNNFVDIFNDVIVYTTLELNNVSIVFKDINTNHSISNIKLDSNIQHTYIKVFLFNNQLVSVVGLDNGNLIIFSINDGKIISNVKISNNAITAFYIKNDAVYILDKENVLFKLNLLNYEHEVINNLSDFVNQQTINNIISLDDKFLISTQSVKLIDINNNETINEYPGHLNAIKEMKIIKNNSTESIFYSFSENDNIVNFYNSNDNNKLILVLSCNENIKQLDYKNENNEEFITVVTQNGNLEIFVNPFSDSSANDGKRRKRNKINKKSNLQIKFTQSDNDLKISYCQNLKDNQLRLLYQSNNTIVSYDFSYDLSLKDYYKENRVEIKAENNIKNTNIINQSDISSKVGYKEGNNYITQGNNYSNLIEQIDTILKNDNDLSFNDLNLNTSNHSSKKKSNIVGTLTTILKQSLVSNDHNLLDQVLNTKDPKIIKLTLWKLSSNLIINFLIRITDKIIIYYNSNNNNNNIYVWLYYTLIIHGNYLIKFNNNLQLKQKLSNLYFIIAKKSSYYHKLVQLNSIINNQLSRSMLYEEKLLMNYENDLIVNGEEYIDSDYEYDEGLDVEEEENYEDDYEEDDDYEDEDDVLLDDVNETGFNIDQDLIPLEVNQHSDVEME